MNVTCVTCQKLRTSTELYWYNTDRGLQCPTCYKREWRHRTGKTRYDLRYRPEFDQHIGIIRDMASKGHNISDIQRTTGLYHLQIVTIAKACNIELVKRKRASCRPKHEEFVQLLKSGTSITKARRTLNINPQTANNLAATVGIIPTPAAESQTKAVALTRLSQEEILRRLPDYMEYVGFKSTKRGALQKHKQHRIRCKICNSEYVREAFSLSRDCQKCIEGKIAKTERSILDWIRSFDLQAEKKIFDNRQELDVYVSAKNVAIEYCGLRWHTEVLGQRSRSYHKNKMKLANNSGIRLITIFEDEWLLRNQQCRNFVKSVLGVYDLKVFARKCEVVAISKADGDRFMEENHIQGPALGAMVYFGLTYEGRTIGVVSGGRHHRGPSSSMMVLDRLCFLDGVQVIGGASRLFSALTKYATEQRYSQVVSWSDNRWSEGRVYEALGFRLEAELPPDYSYVKNKKRYSKQSFQKKCIKSKHPEVYQEGKTESQMMLEAGYDRIWDCGKKRWVYDLKN